MLIQNKKIYVFMVCLVVSCFFVVGCDVITEFFTGEAPDQQTTTQGPVDPQTTTTSQGATSAQSVEMPPNGVIRVGNWVLTEQEFEDRLQALQEALPNFDPKDENAKQMIVDEIISQQLLVKEAKARGLHKKKEIADAIEEFEKTLLVRERAQQLVEDVNITEADARDFYENNPDNFRTQEEWQVREIVVDDQLKANELLLNIMKGESFAKIARENSVSDTASKGGNLGYIANVPFYEMATALNELNEGEVSNVFKGPEGYYIVKVEDKRGGDLREFDEVKEQLMRELAVIEQQNIILEHIKKLREKADVEVNEANL